METSLGHWLPCEPVSTLLSCHGERVTSGDHGGEPLSNGLDAAIALKNYFNRILKNVIYTHNHLSIVGRQHVPLYCSFQNKSKPFVQF